MEAGVELFGEPEGGKYFEELSELFLLFRTLQDVELIDVRLCELSDDGNLDQFFARVRV